MPTCRLTRRLPVGRRHLDPHLERHPALPDERPEERVDGGGHGQAELVQDGHALLEVEDQVFGVHAAPIIAVYGVKDMAPWGHMYVNPGLTEPIILCQIVGA